MTILEYVKNRAAHVNSGFTKGEYLYEGKKYSVEEFNRLFPLSTSRLKKFSHKEKGNNPDISRNYMNDIKSYT